MGLSIEDRAKHNVPGWLYYPHKIRTESRKSEPELKVLHKIVPADRTSIDVGANRGYYSFALSKISKTVEAFEPNPAMARFARRKLGPNVNIHEVALSERAGSTTLYIPQAGDGVDLHLLATIKSDVHQSPRHDEVVVRLARLDEFAFEDVGFIKIDTEGSDIDVLEGARETIAKYRPNMLIELLSGTYSDPVERVRWTEKKTDCEAWVFLEGRFTEAATAIIERRTRITTNNVLLTPKEKAFGAAPLFEHP